MTEQVLIGRGVNIDRVKKGIIKMAAAVLKQNPQDVTLLPEPSDVRLGPAYRLSSLGVKDLRYDSFHIYVREGDITVSLFRLGSHARIVSPDEIGIDWQEFSQAISLSLEELTGGKFLIQFGEPSTTQYDSGEWHYKLPYMLRPTKHSP